MPKPFIELDSDDRAQSGRSARMTVEEVAERLQIGRIAVYDMLKRQVLPGIRLGRRWIITRRAYERWEETCGMTGGSGLPVRTEVTVLN